MQKSLHIRTTVLPGGKIEIAHQELPVGQPVDVVVHHSSSPSGKSAVDILNEAPGQLLFKTGEDVTVYLEEERSSWDR